MAGALARCGRILRPLRLADAYTPEDHYVAVRYAAAEALDAGFTTCHNWAHAVRDKTDAESELRALADSGIRGHFGYGDCTPGTDQEVGPDELEAAAAWCETSGHGRPTLGLAIHNPRALAAEVRLAGNKRRVGWSARAVL